MIENAAIITTAGHSAIFYQSLGGGKNAETKEQQTSRWEKRQKDEENARTDRDTKLRFLETNIFDIADLLPAAHSSYYWQAWVEKMQNIMRKKHEENKGHRDRSARARTSKRARSSCAVLRLAFIQRRSGMWTWAVIRRLCLTRDSQSRSSFSFK